MKKTITTSTMEISKLREEHKRIVRESRSLIKSGKVITWEEFLKRSLTT